MKLLTPSANFKEFVEKLTDDELRSASRSAKQILLALERRSRWSADPAVVPWRGYGPVLALYGFALCTELRHRKLPGNNREFFGRRIPRADFEVPAWMEGNYE